MSRTTKAGETEVSNLISFPYDDSVAMRKAIYAGDVAEICRIHYSRYPNDPGAKEWREQQEKADQSSASTPSASETAQSLLGQDSQQTAPERSKDSSEALELSRIRTLLSDTVKPHLEELRDAFERGALSSSDGKNGTRSNRNADVLVKLKAYLLGEEE